MRSLYWKIFLSFWLATIMVILTTAWITGQIAQKSSIPARERVFMDSYANAAVITYESGEQKALLRWLQETGLNRQMTLFLLCSDGRVIGTGVAPHILTKMADHLLEDDLDDGIIKAGNIIISHEIVSTSGKIYRLAAVSDKPLSHFVQIPWAGLTIRLLIAIVIGGFVCYLLSLYLTRPLRSLSQAARSIATGHLSTRVGQLRGHADDEIADLSREFDRMAEELEEMLNTRERLLQDISHELRSPLARLQVALEIARNKVGDKASKELNRMQTECLRLNSLISEILDFARLNNANMVITPQPVKLEDMIYQLIEDANFEFHGQNRVQEGNIIPCNTMVDARLIHRAIENILRNALKYSPIDEPVIISLAKDAAEEHIYIDIVDKGPGVPDDQLQKIFSPFYRVDTSREKKTGGFGLGLAIASRAVYLHQGEIHASNRPEGGLLVRIILPCHPSNQSENMNH